MKKERQSYRLDLTLFVGRSLLAGDDLAALERVLLTRLGPWSSELHARQGNEKRTLSGGLVDGVRAVASERGPDYKRLVQQYGVGPNQRTTGSVELHGSDGSLIIVVGVDEYKFAPRSGCYHWGNTVAFQFCSEVCVGEATPLLALDIAEQCCREMDIPYAHGHLSEEWYGKNMSIIGSTMAIGVDISRYLPGLYWVNFFGKTYCDLIGRESLLSAPAYRATAVRDGVMLVVDEKPEMWNSPGSNYSRVLAHVGDEFFFLRDNLDRQTRAPEFGLSPLQRHPRFS